MLFVESAPFCARGSCVCPEYLQSPVCLKQSQVMEKLNVIIADRQPVVLIGLEQFFISDFGQDVHITCFTDLNEANDYLLSENKAVDLLLVGHAFTDVGEIRKSVAISVEKFGYSIPILVFPKHDEQVYAPLCLAAGALGFIHRKASFSELNEAIDTVLKKGYFIYGKPVRGVEERIALLARLTRPMERLSPRELEICGYLIRRYSCSEISDRLNIHRSIVSTIKRRIFRKIGIGTDTQLVELWSKLWDDEDSEATGTVESPPTPIGGGHAPA